MSGISVGNRPSVDTAGHASNAGNGDERRRTALLGTEDSDDRALLDALAMLSDGMVASHVGPDGLFHVVAATVSSLLGVRRASLHVWDEESGLFRGVVGHGHPDFERDDAEIQATESGGPRDLLTREIVRTRQPVLVEHVATDPRTAGTIMGGWLVRGLLGVPLIGDERIVAVVFAEAPSGYGPRQEALITRFARFAATAVASALTERQRFEGLSASQREAAALRRVVSFGTELARLAAAHGDVQQLAALLTKWTGHPAAIVDAEHRRLAATPRRGSDVLPVLARPGVTSAERTAAGLDRPEVEDVRVIPSLPAAGVAHRHMVAPFATRDPRSGRILMMELSAAFTSTDRAMLRHAAIVAGGLAGDGTTKKEPADDEEALLRELICGSGAYGVLVGRLMKAGWDAYAPHAVAVIDTRGAVVAGAQGLRSALAEHGLERVLVAPAISGAIVLAPLADDRPVREATGEVRTAIQRACAGLPHPVTAAVSSAVSRLEDLPQATEEARVLAALAERMRRRPSSMVLSVDGLGAGRLLLESTPSKVDQFARQTLGSVLDEPEQKRRDLLQTLDVFLTRASRSARRCAEILHVHENTVRYRLARLQALTGLSVGTDSDDQLTAQTALGALRLQGLHEELELLHR